jgi:hypothetical protein
MDVSIRLKRIYNFLCSMLVLHPLLCVFFTLRGIFIHFPELTYWRDATVSVPCFLLFLYFRKVTQEIFSEMDETKAKVPIYLTRRRSPEERRRWTKGQPHHRVARATPWPRHQVVWPSGPPPDIALPPINSLRQENPKWTNTFPRNILQAAVVVVPRSGGSRSSLPGTLSKRGIINGGLLHHHASLQSDAWVVYLGLRVHRSS